MKQKSRKTSQGRQRLAYEIARMMWEYSIEDFRLAKDKAVRQMGLRHAELPDNREIAQELKAYSSLFSSAEVNEQRGHLFTAGEKLMKRLERFSPRLVGLDDAAVLTPHSRLRLHLFCDHPEVFDLFLQDLGVDYELEDKRFRFGVEDYDYRPAYSFDFEGQAAEVTVFSSANRGRVPLSPVDGRPMQRMSLREVQTKKPAPE